VHFFGTATLSFAEGFKAQAGDVFEIGVREFGKALVNRIEWGRDLLRPGQVGML
jgi:hypothetical protein